MAALPVENTSRLVVDYSHRFYPSQVVYRFAPGVSQAAAITAINGFHTTIRSSMFTNWTVLGTAKWYNEGQTFSSEVAVSSVASGTGPADITSNPDAMRVQFLGRDAFGKRVSWYLAGVAVGMNQVQRGQAGAVTVINAIRNALISLVSSSGLVTITGNAPTLKGYANYVVNDYLTQQARGG